jgi:hypothetical protein
MPSDFAEAGIRLNDAIAVPEAPLSSIRNRSREKSAQHRSHLLIACALAILATVGSGVVLAEKMSGIRIWLSGNNVTVALHSLATIKNPNAKDLRRVLSGATFPVVLPVGIPAGMRLNRIIFAPPDHPNVISLEYRDGKNTLGWEFVLADASAVEHGAIPPLMKSETVRQWNVGSETVIMTHPGEFAGQPEIEAAMLRSTPSESFEQTLPALYRITLPDSDSNSFKLQDFANSIAPVDGQSVLLGRDILSLAVDLARGRKPLVVPRMTTLNNIPTASGKPDLGNASTHMEKDVAVSADGVRAIAAVLATRACGSAPQFRCAVLFNDRVGRPYRIWVLPLPSPASPVKYSVDSKTFHVELDH